MWSIAEEASAPWPNAVLSPDDVLYEFDGPLTFTARFGFFQALFHKVGARHGASFYLVSETTEEKVSALKSGLLSVKGAIEADRYWIVKTDGHLKVISYWSCPDEELPQKFLPESGVPLYSHLPQTADSLAQANAFFAMSFKGPELTRTGMPFSLLRNLTNGAYESARRILSPSFLIGARSATYDFKVRPAVGSLVLALGEPIVDQQRLQNRTYEDPIPFDKVQDYFDAQRESFFDEMDEVVKETRKGSISTHLAAERYYLLDNVSEIVPNGEGRVKTLEFTNTAGDGYRNLIVTTDAGSKIYEAAKQQEKKPIIEIGIVEQINWTRFWFVYKSVNRGRSTVCWSYNQDFQYFIADERLKKGTKVRVRGKLNRRVRRDEIVTEDMPEIIEE